VERDERGRFAIGNPGGPGRPPKGEALTDILKAKLDKDELADLLIMKAREGDLAALKYIYDRVDGKPVETVNQTVREIPEFVRFDTEDDTEDTEADSE